MALHYLFQPNFLFSVFIKVFSLLQKNTGASLPLLFCFSIISLFFPTPLQSAPLSPSLPSHNGMILVCLRTWLAAWCAHQNKIPPKPAWVLRSKQERLESRLFTVGVSSSPTKSFYIFGWWTTDDKAAQVCCRKSKWSVRLFSWNNKYL